MFLIVLARNYWKLEIGYLTISIINDVQWVSNRCLMGVRRTSRHHISQIIRLVSVHRTSDRDLKVIQVPYPSNMTSSGHLIDVWRGFEGRLSTIHDGPRSSKTDFRSALALFWGTSCVLFVPSIGRPFCTSTGPIWTFN